MTTEVTVLLTEEVARWIAALGDAIGRARILERIELARLGDFGDCVPVGSGISEMRIHWGPGYRLYCKRAGKTVYVVLCGGSKRGQQRDIRRACALAKLL